MTKESLVAENATLKQRIAALEEQLARSHQQQPGSSGSIQSVAEPTPAEQTLFTVNQQLETLFSTIHISLAYMDRDFTFLRVNQAYAATDNRDPAFFVGKNHFDLYPNAENEAIFRRVVETGTPHTAYTKPFVFPFNPERGVTYWDWTLEPVTGASGRVERLILSLANVTERVHMETACRAVIQHSLQGLVLFQEGRLHFANPAAAEMVGCSVEELLAMSQEELAQYIHPDDLAVVIHWEGERLEGKDSLSRYEFRIIRMDGAVRWWEAFSTMLDYRGSPAILFTFIDITERKQAEEALRASEARYRTLVNNFPDGVVFLFDHDMRYLVAGGKQLAMLGMSAEMLEGKTLWEATPPEVATMGEPLYRATLAGTAPAEVEQHYGEHVYRTQPVSLRNGQGKVVAGMIISQDITARKRIEEQLHHANAQLQQQAINDSLTGLHNRRYLDETLPREVQRAARQRQSVGVIMLDIDHFKQFNDTYGHDAGDTLLRDLGNFLKRNTRNEDIACRYGGEEFTLVLPGASVENTCKRAEHIRAGVKLLTVQHQGQALDAFTVSLGVAVFPHHGDTADSLIKAADRALYEAKHSGRDRVVVAARALSTSRGGLRREQEDGAKSNPAR